jgi:hypothetical protein
MAHFDVDILVRLNVRVDAHNAREAMDILITRCYTSIENGEISEINVDVLEETATPIED